jgi:hypothetical protein
MDYNIDETWLLFVKTAKPVWTGFVGSLKIGRLDFLFLKKIGNFEKKTKIRKNK